MPRTRDKLTAEQRYYLATQWQLIWRKLKKHKLALIGITVLIILYATALFCEFFSPYSISKRFPEYIYCQPQRIRFFDGKSISFRPFVYGYQRDRDAVTLRRIYRIDEDKKYYIYLFVHGDEYKICNILPMDIHFFGLKDQKGVIFIFGTDKLGRDLFSRNVYAARVSLSIGLVGVAVSFILGCLFGGISGYYGGAVDTVIQRIIEFLLSIPTIPLWMALSAALPPRWSPLKVYFGITVILSVIGWTGLARVVRGKFLELREEDFIMAAEISGLRKGQIILRHLIPSFTSYLIVNLTLSIPWMILGETSLSFLGLGIRAPAVSWGVLLKDAQNVRTLVHAPWLLIPGIFVVVTVLAFNFVGDGIRDAADPYK